jgi:hypothetical protein
MKYSDCVVFVLSQNGFVLSWLGDYLYKTIRKNDALMIPAILDDAGARIVALMLREYGTDRHTSGQATKQPWITLLWSLRDAPEQCGNEHQLVGLV